MSRWPALLISWLLRPDVAARGGFLHPPLSPFPYGDRPVENGMLSQAIINIEQLKNTLNGFSGLPAQAVEIQQNTSAMLNDLLPTLQGMQKQVLTTGQTLQTQLNQQLATLNTETPEQLRAAISQLQEEVSQAAQPASQALTAANAANNKVTQNNLALQQIDVSLQNDIAGLQSNLSGATQELDALNKQKYYWLALGILGVPGLIAMAVELNQAQNKVNDLQGQVNQIQQQIQSQQGFSTQIKSLSANFSTAVDKLSGLDNTINFLKGDMGNISQDIGTASQQQLQLFFTAALMEVNTLVNDAS
ncbi:hypothetical protein [Erwinia psidii]|uniref:hypothetical protein n=1 Tax=Erwinia psidii TaxID=69224 RepID=UPI0018F4E26F|nr:hypothetical protein [Erwinia psidii]